MDWFVYKGSAIDRLPKIIRPFALLARNGWDLISRKGYAHQFDGITTRHNVSFQETPLFRKAYARAVKAGGWDYKIPYRIQQALWCARIAPNGDFVELGTGRGFIMSAVMADQPSRVAHLFDTFSSAYLDDSGNVIEAASGYYATSFEEVERNFAEWPTVSLYRGDVFDTLPAAKFERVGFLHVDLNHADVEVFGIRHLWPLMPKGAVMLLDDYAYAEHESQYRSINALADELGFHVLSTPTGQGIVVKAGFVSSQTTTETSHSIPLPES